MDPACPVMNHYANVFHRASGFVVSYRGLIVEGMASWQLKAERVVSVEYGTGDKEEGADAC